MYVAHPVARTGIHSFQHVARHRHVAVLIRLPMLERDVLPPWVKLLRDAQHPIVEVLPADRQSFPDTQPAATHEPHSQAPVIWHAICDVLELLVFGPHDLSFGDEPGSVMLLIRDVWSFPALIESLTTARTTM